MYGLTTQELDIVKKTLQADVLPALPLYSESPTITQKTVQVNTGRPKGTDTGRTHLQTAKLFDIRTNGTPSKKLAAGDR